MMIYKIAKVESEQTSDVSLHGYYYIKWNGLSWLTHARTVELPKGSELTSENLKLAGWTGPFLDDSSTMKSIRGEA